MGAEGSVTPFYTADAESSGAQSSRRGIAHDGLNRRLFLSHHDVSGDANSILVVPVD